MKQSWFITIWVFFGVIALNGRFAEAAWEIRAKVAEVDTVAVRFQLEEISALVDTLPESLGDTESVAVFAGDARVGYAGKYVIGKLVKSGDDWSLQSIWPADKMAQGIERSVNDRLRRDTLERGRKVYRGLGDTLPDFALYNQSGELVRKDSFRGQYWVLNFIFTRCAVAKMCPAATARMVRLQKETAEAGVGNFALVSISFDPEYDTPGILNEYGTQRGMDFSNFSLLTGEQRAIKDLMKQFGILIVPEDGTLNHTMGTLLINPYGKIVYRKDGSRWSTQDFLRQLQLLQKANP